MATGVNGHERLGINVTTAARPHRDSNPLPSNDAVVELSYKGKLAERDILEPVRIPYVTLNQEGDTNTIESICSNAVVLSDNYYALHALLESKRKATLIYLDPPFGTGMDFQSRNLEHAYTDKMGQAAYIEFMRRRLILLRELLATDGSIYIHTGHQMLGHLKVLMDEIFGRRNFRNIIVRRKCSSKNFTRKQYPNLNDYILFYSKSSSYKWNQPGEKPSEEWILREYPKIDDRGRYRLVPVHAPGTRRGETGKTWRGKKPPPGKHWQYTPTRLDEFDARNEIHWSRNGNPRRKVYLERDKTISLTDYWAKFRDAHHQSIRITGYPTEKNLDMLKVIVAASSDPGDLVIDPFCGSGTTLHAAHETGRDWIGIDESFEAMNATLQRLRHGMQQMGDYVNSKKIEKAVAAGQLFAFPDAPQNPDAASTSVADFQFIVDSELLDVFGDDIRRLAATELASPITRQASNQASADLQPS